MGSRLGGGSLRFLKVYQPYGSSDFVVIFFLDITGLDVSPESLYESLKNVPIFKKVELIRPVIDGLIIDTYSFPQFLAGDRAVVFRRANYEAWIRKMREKYGDTLNAILYHIGFEAGQNAYKHLSRKYDTSDRDILELASEFAKVLGYGVFDVERLSSSEAIVKVYGSFECELFGNSGKPEGHLVRGMIAGSVAAIWNVEMDEVEARETRCIAKGDPYCEFHIRKKGGIFHI